MKWEKNNVTLVYLSLVNLSFYFMFSKNQFDG